MDTRELRDGRPMTVRNAPLPPSVQALMGQLELAPDDARADLIDQLAMGVSFDEHSAFYQRSVDISSGISFIALHDALNQNSRMGFGERLKAAIKAAGFKNPRRFAIDGLGWDEASGPQRLNNYIQGRIPDRDVLALMAKKLGTTPESLLNEKDDENLRDILLRLLELEGIPADRADTIASVFLVARRLHSGSVDEGEPRIRARLAAQYAWQSQPPLSPDR